MTIAAVVLGAALIAGGWVFWPFWQIARQFGSIPEQQPSRLYGRPYVLTRGATLDVERLRTSLQELDYRAGPRPSPGRYVDGDGGITIGRRRFFTVDGADGEDTLRVTLRSGRVADLEVDGRDVDRASLEPPLIASFYGPDLQERRPIPIDALPEDLVYAVLAAEDAGFLDHRGISITGVLRAAWVNFRAQGVRQGGSTLTQQLVKNRYLTHDRRLVRKIQEAVLAVLIDRRYGKRAILEAYLNEIYWGRSGSVDLMGIGAASWAYFGIAPNELDLAQSAMLAGIIRSPGRYSPRAHPERAEAQKDHVLRRLAELRWIEPARIEAALEQPLGVVEAPLIARRAPFFADAMTREAQRRFGIEELRDTGYILLSTIDPAAQEAAEDAVRWGVAALEEGWEKDANRSSPLQAALISVEPDSGAIEAYVGGRDYAVSQFDRVANARRQAGSAFKPIVYAAGFAAGLGPASLFEDAPFGHTVDGRTWRPANSDGRYRGWVSARAALEQSLNVPTAKLGLRVGLNHIVDLARKMGISSKLEPYPALTLGAMAVTPYELATVYATLAAGGERPEVHGLEAIFDRSGEAVAGRPLATPEPVLREDAAYLVTHVLQGVLDVGTASSVRRQGIQDRLAGKTGTTNDRRDSWFAGYAPSRASLVWVGYDDNATTKLSGSRAALPIWARFIGRMRPRGGYPTATAPAGVVRALVDPETGLLARQRCPRVTTELFLRDLPPRGLCPRHRGSPLRQFEDGVEVTPERGGNPFRRWLDRMRKNRRPPP